VALDLGMSECNYSKIENGYKTISIGKLRKIAKSLDVSLFLILALAESEHLVEDKLVPLSDILLKFIQAIRNEENELSEDEVSFILSRIRQSVAS
jgi:transcriptional regulator with XRE-family HTH domain